MNETIIITNMLETNTSFGVIASSGEGVFVPASLARQFDLEIGDEYEATLAPNTASKREVTPWRVIKLTGAPIMPEDDAGDEWCNEDVLDILADHDGSMLANDVAVELFGSAKPRDVRDVTSVLEDLVQRSKAVKATITFGPLTELRYAADLDAFR